MQLTCFRDRGVGESRARLDDSGGLGIALALVLPDVDGCHAGQNVDARGEAAVHQDAADALGFGRRRVGRIDQNGFVVLVQAGEPCIRGDFAEGAAPSAPTSRIRSITADARGLTPPPIWRHYQENSRGSPSLPATSLKRARRWSGWSGPTAMCRPSGRTPSWPSAATVS